MAFGPFENYAPPGAYTRTRVQDDTTGPPAGSRIPVLIGTGQETLGRDDFELVRGSSSSVDQRIVNEDVNERFITDFTNPDNPELGSPDGTLTRFKVRNLPIVAGDGRGVVTNDTSRITVTVDGELVAPLALDGARGVVTLQIPPQAGQDVRISYSFNRTDTEFTDDVSAQVTKEDATLVSVGAGPFAVAAGFNVLNLNVDGVTYEVPLTVGTAVPATTIVSDINAVVAGDVPGFASVAGGDRVQLQSAHSIEVLTGSANTAIGFGAGTRTNRTRTFYVYNAPVVDGTNGGITTTDPSDVTVHVGGQQVVPVEVDGQSGSITLAKAPAAGEEVTIRYFHNTWQDTFDYLPDTGIRNVDRVGISPGRRDFTEGNDYVIDENGRILWGSAVTVETGQHTGGTELFGDNQIDATLIDNRMYLEETERYIDRSVTPARVSDTEIVLSNTPTLGNARSTELDLGTFQKIANNRIPVSTFRPGLIKVYHGSNASEAIDRGPVEVLRVDPTTRRVTLSEPIPPDHTVWASYYYNRLQDDTFTVEVLTEALMGGTYKVSSDLLGSDLYDVRFGSKSATTFTVGWKSGTEASPDAFHVGTDAVDEVVTVTFKDIEALPAIFVNRATEPYDFYAGVTDTLYIYTEADIEAEDPPDVVVDLSVGAHGTLVSEAHDDGATFEIINGENDEFNFEVDGTPYNVTLTPGAAVTGTDIATEINTAVGLANDVAYYRDGNGVEKDRFILRSLVVPSGPEDGSVVRVLSGSANETLGFVEGAESYGTENALNKGATLLGDTVTDPLTANATLLLTINDQAVSVDLDIGDDITAVVGKINTELGAEGTATAEGGAIRITSTDVGPNSSIVIGEGDANGELGFSEGDSASQRRVTLQELVSAINMELLGWTPTTVAADLNNANAFADTFEVIGDGDYLRLTTFAEGSASFIVFGGGTASALDNTTGIGINVRDGANGSDSKVGFDVTSNVTGGSGGEGLVGQTYTDDTTGLRFSVLEALSGQYNAGDSFTLVVSDTFTAGTSKVVKALPGLEIVVEDTVNAGVGDTALISTYRSNGLEPGVGDFYYITYQYEKTDFSARLFTRFRDIQANFGTLSVENPLTLASYLAILNGAVVVGCKQVRKAPGGATAPSSAFIDALDELGKPLEAGLIPDILVPLTTDPSVMGAYVNHADIQSSMRYRQERRCIFGVASGTLPNDARQIARGLANRRAILVYPDSAVVTLEDVQSGDERNFVVDGTYVAAALAGVMVSPQFDVATPLTRRTLVGFRRLNRRLDDVDKNRVATAGITVLEERGTSLQVRDGLTTDMTSRFTSTPSIVAIADHVERQTRNTLERFIGLKFLADRVQDVELAVTGLLKTLVEQQIIVDFRGVRAEADPNDPTSLRVSAFYAPVFPLKYIPVTYTIGASSAL